jgi:hypothetical protein
MKSIKMFDPTALRSMSLVPAADAATTELPVTQEETIPFFRDYQFWNVFGLSVAFMVLYSAIHTCGMLQVSKCGSLIQQKPLQSKKSRATKCHPIAFSVPALAVKRPHASQRIRKEPQNIHTPSIRP